MNMPVRTRRLSPRARQGGLLLLAALVIMCIAAVLPFVWQADLRQEAMAQKAERDLVAARVGKAAGTRAPRLTAADDPQRMFLAGETEGTALAAFQSLVSAAADRSGLSVLRMQPLPADAGQGLAPARLAVDCAGSLDQLRAFLADIESALPVVIVTGLEAEPRAAMAEAQPYPSEDLAISLKLEAYSWRDAK